MQYRFDHALSLLASVAILSGCGSSDSAPLTPPLPDQDAQIEADSTRPAVDAHGDSAIPDTVQPDVSMEAGHDAQTDADSALPQDSADASVDEDAATDSGQDAPVDPGLDLGGGLTLRPSQPAAGTTVTLEYHGSLSASANVSLHYGFNGWNEMPGVTLTSADDGTGNLDFFAEAPLAPMAGGGWQGAVVVPANTRALHVVLFTEQGGTRTWDSNAGLDYNAGIPLVLHGPVLTWDGTVQAHDGVVVNFHTGWPCKGAIAFGTGGALTQTQQETTASRAHHVHLQGLQGATEYSYQVACDQLTEPAVRTFRTAAADATKLSFVVLGDIQETGEANRWKRTADLVLQNHPDVGFIVSTGDMPWNDKAGLWWTFFDQGRELLGSRALVPALGNHDVNLGETAPGKTSFERYLALDSSSGSERYYVQKYGSAAFLVLDSEIPDDFALGTGAQFAWASQRLTSPPLSNSPWVFGLWHIPPYNAGARHWTQQGTFRDMTSLFDGKLDWVFGGHEHLYQRMKPLRYNATLASSGNYGRGANDGVGYVAIPAAGAWPEVGLIASTDPKAYYRDRLAFPSVPSSSDTTASENGYVIVSIDGPTMQLETWGVGGPGAPVAPHLIDQVAYSH
jgi:hypothetical protein